MLDKTAGKMKIWLNKNTLTAAITLACLAEIRSRNEEATEFYTKQDLLSKCFLLPTLSRSSILQDIYFLFVSEFI